MADKDFHTRKETDGQFEETSGAKDFMGNTIEYSITTDSSQGFQYTNTGNKFDACLGTSYELCGENLQESGQPGKVIKAFNGNIHIEAMNGDIVLIANNIRLRARDGSGEITLVANSQVHQQAPIVNQKGTISNSLMSNSTSIAANAVDTAGGIQNTSGTLTDVTQGSFLGGLIKVLQKFKKWLECGG
jgi:hypothetical protein